MSAQADIQDINQTAEQSISLPDQTTLNLITHTYQADKYTRQLVQAYIQTSPQQDRSSSRSLIRICLSRSRRDTFFIKSQFESYKTRVDQRVQGLRFQGFQPIQSLSFFGLSNQLQQRNYNYDLCKPRNANDT